ncbi:MAG: hypothetical protein ACREVA_02915 [Burkholderiales bacterium]
MMALQKKKAVPITPLMTIARLLLPASVVLLAAACGTAYAEAGDTLAQVKSRGAPITLCQLAVSALYVLSFAHFHGR